MKKLRPIILAVVITIISITGIVLVSNNVSAISGGNQGNGDCWGIDIFTDAATENKTTSKTPTTMTIATTPLQKITVGRTTVKKVTIKKKTAKIRLKSVKGATGYIVKFSNSSKFTKAKTKKVKNINCVIRKIKKSRRYYVKARAYKKNAGKIYYGQWSKVKRK